ncbi:hypothetical protein BJX99DRAFT_27741 [Aspergillus californicus]
MDLLIIGMIIPILWLCFIYCRSRKAPSPHGVGSSVSIIKALQVDNRVGLLIMNGLVCAAVLPSLATLILCWPLLYMSL